MNDKVNEIKISYKEKMTTSTSNAIKSSTDAGKLLFHNWDKNTIGLQESFKVLLIKIFVYPFNVQLM